MADFRRRTWVMRNRPSITPRVMDEEITPSSGWTENPDFHFLIVDLPGFGKDDIKFSVNESGVIVISGRKKKIGEERQVHFQKTFNVPENGDVQSINMKFEGESLRVIIPKLEKEKKHPPETINGASSTANKEQNTEAMAFPSSSDLKEKLESPGSSSDSRQESPTPSKDDSKEKEEFESPGAGSDSRQESLTPTKDDSKEKEKLESPGAGSDSRQDSPTPSENGSKEKEKLESPGASSGIIQEKKDISENLSEHQKEQSDGEGGEKSRGRREEGPQKTVIVKIIENKGIFLASIISFTLGVLFSQRFHPPSPK